MNAANSNATKVATMLKKANIALMRHPEYKVMAGMFVSGETTITDSISTACTDGWNKMYNADFMSTLTQAEVTFVVAHENMHNYLKHGRRFRQTNINHRLANAAMDYAINAFLHGTKDKSLMTMPKCALYNPMFDNMSVEEIYSILKKNAKPKGKSPCDDGDSGDSGDAGDVEVVIGGTSIPLDGFDEHDGSGKMTEEEEKEVSKKIDRAIQQGAILAGIMGQDLPRIVKEAMEVEVNWEDELQEFVTSSCAARDDYSYRRLDRRWLASNDDMMVVPTLMQENVNEVMIAADTSGSIDDKAMGAWLATVARICEAAQPDVVRVIFWDTDVRSEQVFDRSQIPEIATLMKPRGGGGTTVSCVSKYITQRGLSPDCLIVLTDGYVEGDINWATTVPTLWTVTQNKNFRPSAGRVVKINN